eukprot:gene15148-6337_t
MKCPLNTYQTTINSTSCIQCGNGTVARESGATGCVSLCPKGTFINGTSCQGCPLGYYQEEAEKTSCIKCPNNTITRRGHSTSISDCTEPCTAGQFKSKDGCKPCKNGMYQDIDVHAYEFCKFCRKGTTTIEYGSKSNDSCVVACFYEGEYYDPKDGQCKKCPVGTYKLASDKQILTTTAHQTPVNFQDGAKIQGRVLNVIVLTITSDSTVKIVRMYVSRSLASIMAHAIICIWETITTDANAHLHLQEKTAKVNITHVLKINTFATEETAPTVVVNLLAIVHHGTKEPIAKLQSESRVWTVVAACMEIVPMDPTKDQFLRTPARVGSTTLGKTVKQLGFYKPNSQAFLAVIDDCVKNDCNKTGTEACEDREKGFYCSCKIGYIGDKCGEALGCPPGEGFDGKCFKCGIGKFQPFRGHFDCQNCPDKKTTLEEAATSRDQCIEKESFVKLKATVRITSENWSDDLLNKNSYSYVQLRKKLEDAFKKTYANESKYVAVVIESIRKGSIVCEFSLYFKSGVESPAKPLKAKVETGSLGEFTVDKDSYKEVIVEESHKKKKNNYTLMAVLLVVGVLVAIGVVTLCLLHARQKKRARVRFDKMLMDETATIEYPMTDK